ncbi:hypothetical protein DL98DRAFT_58318 [Cadophora sp. DSE1049]|nr:hypothetical protein DL98DRAFT_58318 [Cadophora sp. DSE1049]
MNSNHDMTFSVTPGFDLLMLSTDRRSPRRFALGFELRIPIPIPVHPIPMAGSRCKAEYAVREVTESGSSNADGSEVIKSVRDNGILCSRYCKGLGNGGIHLRLSPTTQLIPSLNRWPINSTSYRVRNARYRYRYARPYAPTVVASMWRHPGTKPIIGAAPFEAFNLKF